MSSSNIAHRLAVPFIVGCAAANGCNAQAQFAVAEAPDWRAGEAGTLSDQVQLTFPDRFVKAGESYFSPDGSKIIFQGIEHVAEGETAEAHYQMYVGQVVSDAAGNIVAIDEITRLSPVGSSNTCGWFHPTRPGVVVFGSTVVPPTIDAASGYQRGVSRYIWHFPKEMTIVECDLTTADGTAASLRPLVQDPAAYLAECAMSPNGRFMVYCKRVESEGQVGGDLIVHDFQTRREVIVAGNLGYDGGPFFSPDGTRLCYRSDRRGDDLLQVFVAELAFNEADGSIIGLAREFQLTDNPYVNWAPYWHPAGRQLLYTTNEISPIDHSNYEIFVIDADAGGSGGVTGGGGPARYGTKRRRITFADGFDGLPAFAADGRTVIWTSQRGEGGSSQLWAAKLVLDLDAVITAPGETDASSREPDQTMITIRDDERGIIYLYNPKTHELQAYDPATHKSRQVTENTEMQRALELYRRSRDIE
ncbi:MAG: TolB family protein [Phycisphaerales bacterium]